MNSIYLSDAELRAKVAEMFKVPTFGWDVSEYRFIADAAVDNMTKVLIEFMDEEFGYGNIVARRMKYWLKEQK